MGLTKIDICNQALFHLGLSSISDLDDGSDINAMGCKIFYESVLSKALRDHPWGFAKSELALTQEGDFMDYPSYHYAYQYPYDCAYILKIVNPAGKKSEPIEYDIQANKNRTGKVILTNQACAVLSYIVEIDDPNLYDSHFTEMLVYALATALALKLTGDTSKQKNMSIAYQRAKDEAKAVAANENYEKQELYNNFLNTRN